VAQAETLREAIKAGLEEALIGGDRPEGDDEA
jgi:hypothetical protein